MALRIVVKETKLAIGDAVRVAQKIKEGDKERIQNYDGTLIAISGNHGERTITVRRIATGGVGVEKIFPIDLPSLVKVTVLGSANVRRSKLYYLRKRKGKFALKLNERIKEIKFGDGGRKRNKGVARKKKKV